MKNRISSFPDGQFGFEKWKIGYQVFLMGSLDSKNENRISSFPDGQFGFEK